MRSCFESARSGVQAHCPYCSGALVPWLPIGTRIKFLTGIHVGRSAVVASEKQVVGGHEFFNVELESSLRTDSQFMVAPSNELYIEEVYFETPNWLAPLSIEDNASIHFGLFGGIINAQGLDQDDALRVVIKAVASACWWGRFPITGSEIWPFLEAHGIGEALRSVAIDYFDFGSSILISNHCRPPNKRRRMVAMSRGKYATPKQRQIHLNMMGHDYGWTV